MYFMFQQKFKKIFFPFFNNSSNKMGDYSADWDSPDYTYDDVDDLGSSKSKIMPATRELVNELIASDSVVIFSKTYCPYCTMAKEVFDKLKHKYTAIELDSRDDGDEIQSILSELTGARTVPRVFVKGECLGGGTDVKKMFESGELSMKLSH
ncbi:uncharacterized protein [Neodiprion pinetum]|uniref:glutaredoxin-like isoform X1 n=1 Tax=Neodiprion fabricii TaxID=2872261 RepID=UPI001ED92447|nr:glutaredoxin-like isoform X1 [Neodiprion fabricii]XP_046473859.1 glutaredoxin-like isoform X1 [Neodiprion pinetum]XP_046613914.1 glutaredoxin-like isoform X1 [Neodiprion virginianus]